MVTKPNKLTDLQIRRWIEAREHFEQRGDGGWLFLSWPARYAAPFWRFRYRLAGAQRIMQLRRYSDVPLKEARDTAKRLRARIALGEDVSDIKQEEKKAARASIEAKKNIRTVAILADAYFERTILGRWKHPNIVRSRIDKDTSQPSARWTRKKSIRGTSTNC